MEQEKFGKLIKDLRKKHNLTQKDLADKLGVTYQAVSKWENGINMPDTTLIKKISDDFGISLNAMLDGEYKKKKKQQKLFIGIVTSIILVIVVLGIIMSLKKGDFSSKILSSNSSDFNVSGIISYTDNKSTIYINNIKYHGSDLEDYQKIECTLYETSDNYDKKISSMIYDEEETTKLENFLSIVTLSIDDYEKICKEYNDDTLYISILATNKENKTTSYKIPLKMDSNCGDD